MAVTTDTLRPRAFDPTHMTSARPPATPGWDIGPERRIDDGRMVATGMAWFSLGLGLVEVLAAEQVCDYLGMEDSEGLVRLMGFREIASGIGIMSQREPTEWMLGRVAGDILDLAVLATALGPKNRKRNHVIGAIGAVVGALALDVLGYRQLSTRPS